MGSNTSTEAIDREVKKAKQSMSEEHKKRLDELLLELKDLRNSKESLRNTISDLKASKASAEKEVELMKENQGQETVLKKQLADSVNQIGTLRCDLASARAQLESEQKSVTLMKSKESTITMELTEEKQKAGQFANSIAISEMENQNLRENAIKLQNELDHLKQTCANVKSQLSLSKQSCSSLEKEVEILKVEKAALESDKKDKDALITELRKELFDLQKKHEVDREKIANLKENLTVLKAKYQEAEKKLLQLKADSDSQRKVHEAKESETRSGHASERRLASEAHSKQMEIQHRIYEDAATRTQTQNNKAMQMLADQQKGERETSERAMARVENANDKAMDFIKSMFQMKQASEQPQIQDTRHSEDR